MQTPQRRVRKLKISSQNEATLASDLHALQDALNIATFPGVQPNGLLLVRKLDLGVIRPRSSNLGLSRSIDSRIQCLRMQSVCVDEEDAPGHDVVWFSDPAQAVFRLVDLVAGNHQIKAWYWTVLFPEYRPDMSLEAVLMLVSKDFIDTESRLWVMASVIQQLCTKGHTQKMLVSIKPSLAQALLIDSGIDPRRLSSIANRKNSPAYTPLRVTEIWQEVIELSINRWGRNDVTTLWMAVNALVMQNPAMVKAGQLLIRDVHILLDQIDQNMTTDRDGFSAYSCDEHADLFYRTLYMETTASKGNNAPVNISLSKRRHQREHENIQSKTPGMSKIHPHQPADNTNAHEEHRQEPVVSTAQKLKQKNDFEQTDPATPGIDTDSDFEQQTL